MKRSKTRFLPLVVVIIAAGAWLIAWLAAGSGLPTTTDQYDVDVSVPSAAFIGTGANVTVAGLKVGRVGDVQRQAGGAKLTLTLDRDYAPIARDSRVAVRLRSVVGENYVEITPGKSSSMLPDGGALAIDHAERYVNVDEILNSLRGRTRTRARATLNGLADGFRDHGSDFNATFGGLAETVSAAVPVTRVLAEHDAQIARLTDDLGVITRLLGDREDQITRVAVSGRVTAEAVASRDAAVRDVLSQMPTTLRSVQTATATLADITDRATPTLLDTGRLLDDLAPATRTLGPAARAALSLTSELDRAAPPLTEVAAELSDAAPGLAAALPKTRAVMCEANPFVAFLKPYSLDLGTVIQNMGSANNSYDATGHTARLHLAFGENQLKIFDPATANAIRSLTELGAATVRQTAYNPFPKPGQAGETFKRGDPRGYADVKTPYPRVQAEC